MAQKATWEPPKNPPHGKLTEKEQKELADSAFAFPKERKEPLTDPSHVKDALARFDQVKNVSDAERELAFANIKKAAQHFGIQVDENDWHELGKKPHTPNPAHEHK